MRVCVYVCVYFSMSLSLLKVKALWQIVYVHASFCSYVFLIVVAYEDLLVFL